MGAYAAFAVHDIIMIGGHTDLSRKRRPGFLQSALAGKRAEKFKVVQCQDLQSYRVFHAFCARACWSLSAKPSLLLASEFSL